MEEKKVMHYSFAKGNRGRWMFPVDIKPSDAKTMRDDGVQIYPLESEFVLTPTMKVYGVHVQGDNKNWVLVSLLEPEIAEEMRRNGVGISEEIEGGVNKLPIIEKVVEAEKTSEPEEAIEEKEEDKSTTKKVSSRKKDAIE